MLGIGTAVLATDCNKAKSKVSTASLGVNLL